MPLSAYAKPDFRFQPVTVILTVDGTRRPNHVDKVKVTIADDVWDALGVDRAGQEAKWEEVQEKIVEIAGEKFDRGDVEVVVVAQDLRLPPTENA